MRGKSVIYRTSEKRWNLIKTGAQTLFLSQYNLFELANKDFFALVEKEGGESDSHTIAGGFRAGDVELRWIGPSRSLFSLSESCAVWGERAAVSPREFAERFKNVDSRCSGVEIRQPWEFQHPVDFSLEEKDAAEKRASDRMYARHEWRYAVPRWRYATTGEEEKLVQTRERDLEERVIAAGTKLGEGLAEASRETEQLRRNALEAAREYGAHLTLYGER